MSESPCLLPGGITELFADVVAAGELTLADRCGIRDALLFGTMNEDDQHCIDRLIYCVRRGYIRLSSN